MTQPHRIPQHKPELRRDIYGERPLSPLVNAPVVYKPNSIIKRALWLSLFALSASLILFVTVVRL